MVVFDRLYWPCSHSTLICFSVLYFLCVQMYLCMSPLISIIVLNCLPLVGPKLTIKIRILILFYGIEYPLSIVGIQQITILIVMAARTDQNISVQIGLQYDPDNEWLCKNYIITLVFFTHSTNLNQRRVCLCQSRKMSTNMIFFSSYEFFLQIILLIS